MDEQALRDLDYSISVAVGAMIEALGMHAENQIRLSKGDAPAYSYKQFEELMLNRGLHHNAVIERQYPQYRRS